MGHDHVLLLVLGGTRTKMHTEQAWFLDLGGEQGGSSGRMLLDEPSLAFDPRPRDCQRGDGQAIFQLS